MERVGVKCPDHPVCTKALLFDKDCKRVICFECRRGADEHKTHEKEAIELALQESDTLLNGVGAFIPQFEASLQYSVEIARRARECDARQEEALLEAANEWLVTAIARLLQLMDRLKAKAQVHDRPDEPNVVGPSGWSIAEATARSEALKALIDRAKLDENVSLAAQKEVPRLQDELKEWMDATKLKTLNPKWVSVNTAAYFKTTMQKCNEALEMLEVEFGKALAGIQYRTSFTQLGETSVIEQEKLVNEAEKSDFLILGIAPAEAKDCFYFVDANHSKIKNNNSITTNQYSV